MDNQNNPQTANQQVTDLFTLENLIKNHISHVESVKIELSKQAEMMTDILNNDPKYKEAQEKGKEVAKQKNEAKQDILKSPSNASLNQKIKDMRQELKELKNALSNYLQQYQKIADTDQIEGDNGEVRQIVYSAHLVKLSNKFGR